MVDRPSDPPALDLDSLPGPESIHRSELTNGMVVLVRENFASPSVVIGGYLHAGSLYEPSNLNGLAGLTASALMRGTEDQSFREIYERIESIGATLRVGGGMHFASFRGKSLAGDLDTLLTVLADVLQVPVFPEKEIAQLRGEKLTGLALRDQDTRAVAGMTFDALAYADHPYQWPLDGRQQTVERLSPAELHRFHGERYGPQGMVLTLVGAVSAERAVELVQGALGGWSQEGAGSAEGVEDKAAPDEIIRREVALAGKTQADIVLGSPGPRRSDSGYLAAALGNNILGRFGLMGRIGDRVRDDEGLAYYAFSSLNGGLGPGPWQVVAGVNPVNIERAIDLIRAELGRFVEEEVTEEELADVQANYIGRLPLQLESNEGVASALIHIERHGLGLDYYQRFPQLVRQVTREQVLAAAQRYLDPDRLAIAVAGPGEGEP